LGGGHAGGCYQKWFNFIPYGHMVDAKGSWQVTVRKMLTSRATFQRGECAPLRCRAHPIASPLGMDDIDMLPKPARCSRAICAPACSLTHSLGGKMLSPWELQRLNQSWTDLRPQVQVQSVPKLCDGLGRRLLHN